MKFVFLPRLLLRDWMNTLTQINTIKNTIFCENIFLKFSDPEEGVGMPSRNVGKYFKLQMASWSRRSYFNILYKPSVESKPYKTPSIYLLTLSLYFFMLLGDFPFLLTVETQTAASLIFRGQTIIRCVAIYSF